MLSKSIEQFVKASTGASGVEAGEQVQALWSGYGEIRRLRLTGAEPRDVILKAVTFPSEVHHPRGWHSDFSHQRKVKSYHVEMAWYQNWAVNCDESCRVATCFGAQAFENGVVILLEDLDAAGWDIRHDDLDLQAVKQCLRWLAAFHARFLLQTPAGLWDEGSYWHLATRPDEWQAMAAHPIKEAAQAIDHRLAHSRFQTLIHGDAKVANFCFSSTQQSVAAVDFQYVGAGCGMKDVAYLLGSCLTSEAIDRHETALLAVYFDVLKAACGSSVDTDALEQEWRDLYCFAWADFYRFLLGWMPTHQKINPSMRRLSQQALAKID